MISENTYNIDNIIDKKLYIEFLDNKKDKKAITECQYELIKNSFIHKYKKNNQYPKSTNNLLDNYIKYCKSLNKDDNESLTRIQILLNYYYTFEKSNNIMLKIINSKNISDELILSHIHKKSIIMEEKNCMIDKNVIYYLYKSYKSYVDKIKENSKKHILYIRNENYEKNDIYIKEIKYYFKKFISKMDIYDIIEKNEFTIIENKYDIVFVDHSIANINNLKELFEKISFISKENSLLYIFGYDIFTEKDQYIKLMMDKIKHFSDDKSNLTISYPFNLFEIEFILSQYNFILYYSNEFTKKYSTIPSFIQDYIGLFINRKI